MQDHTSISIPATGYAREWDLVNRPPVKANPEKHRRARPATRGFLNISGPTLWRGVKAGTFPKPVKLGDRITAWRWEDVRAWMAAREATK